MTRPLFRHEARARAFKASKELDALLASPGRRTRLEKIIMRVGYLDKKRAKKTKKFRP